MLLFFVREFIKFTSIDPSEKHYIKFASYTLVATKLKITGKQTLMMVNIKITCSIFITDLCHSFM